MIIYLGSTFHGFKDFFIDFVGRLAEKHLFFFRYLSYNRYLVYMPSAIGFSVFVYH